jgi:hypothetical protein
MDHGPLRASTLLTRETLMRFPTRLLILPLTPGISVPAAVGEQARQSPAPATAESIPVSVRWDRLIPRDS